jgi:hypothetical protein
VDGQDDLQAGSAAALDAQLRAMFQDAAGQPLPANLLQLLEDLEDGARAPQSRLKAVAG